MNKIEEMFEKGMISQEEYYQYLKRKLPFLFKD